MLYIYSSLTEKEREAGVTPPPTIEEKGLLEEEKSPLTQFKERRGGREKRGEYLIFSGDTEEIAYPTPFAERGGGRTD